MSRAVFATAGLMLMAAAPVFPAQAGTSDLSVRARADAICGQVMGLRPGETYFAICRENLSRFLPEDHAAPVAITYSGDTGTQAGKSFYEVAPIERWNRERQACAQMGLTPASAAFDQCVTGLDTSFLPSPN